MDISVLSSDIRKLTEKIWFTLIFYSDSYNRVWGHRGPDRMVVGFITTYTISTYITNVVSLNPVHGEMYSIQHYVIEFLSDLRQVGGFSGYSGSLHQ
jgi:hypothetical protein